MTESRFWKEHVSKLKSFGRAERMENLIAKGTSDVIYCLRWREELPRMGWIELKKLPAWPAFATTTVKLPHYTVDQATFLEWWGRAGAGAFLLAQVGQEFLLWPWQHARDVQLGMVRARMVETASVHSKGAFPVAKVLRCLTRI